MIKTNEVKFYIELVQKEIAELQQKLEVAQSQDDKQIIQSRIDNRLEELEMLQSKVTEDEVINLLVLSDEEKQDSVNKTIRLTQDIINNSNEKVIEFSGEIGTLESIDLYYRQAKVKVRNKIHNVFFYNVDVLV